MIVTYGNILGFLGNIFGAGINAAANTAAQNSANRTNIQIARETNQANRELAEYQYAMNLAQWNRENEYNLPANQMARYTAAGLNPNLVAGGVGSSVGTAASSPSYDAPTMQGAHVGAYTGMDFRIGEAVDYLLRKKQVESTIERQVAETEELKSQKNLTDARIASENARTAGYLLGNSRTKFDYDLAKDLRDTTVRQAKESLRLTSENASLADARSGEIDTRVQYLGPLLSAQTGATVRQGLLAVQHVAESIARQRGISLDNLWKDKTLSRRVLREAYNNIILYHNATDDVQNRNRESNARVSNTLSNTRQTDRQTELLDDRQVQDWLNSGLDIINTFNLKPF